MKFILFDIENESLVTWDLNRLLFEINSDRSDDWSNYNQSDYMEGWNEWCEGDFYKLLMIKTK